MKKRAPSEVSDSGNSDSSDAPQSKNNRSKNSDSSGSDSDSSTSSSSSSSSDSREVQRRKSNSISHSSAQKSPVSGNPIQKFVALNPEYEIVPGAEDVFSDDDEVSFIQIPRSVHPEKFIGKEINFEGKCKIKIEGAKFVIKPNYETEPVTIMTNTLKTIKPLANFQVQKYVKEKHKGDIIGSEKSKVSLPENLKVRHPLFGPDFENKIVLDEEIERKLNSVISDVLTSKKKKKKNKEKARNEEERVFSFTKPIDNEESHEAQDIFNFSLENKQGNVKIEEFSMKKDKKKKKDRLDVKFINAETSEKKAKKKTIEPEELVATPSESLFTDSLQNYVNNLTASETSAGEESIKKKKKSKKNKSVKAEFKEEFTITNQQNSFNLSEPNPQKKSKKNRSVEAEFTQEDTGPNQQNSFIFNEPSLPEESVLVGQKVKKNKSVKRELSNNEIVLKAEEGAPVVQEKKKKKKIKSEVFSEAEDREPESRRKSIINSTAISDFQLPNFDLDVSRIYGKELQNDIDEVDNVNTTISLKSIKNEKLSDNNDDMSESSTSSKKKKKKQKKNVDQNNASTSKKRKLSYSFSEDMSEASPRKKVKKIKQEKGEHSAEESQLINDILSSVKTEMDNSSHRKKKKINANV